MEWHLTKLRDRQYNTDNRVYYWYPYERSIRLNIDDSMPKGTIWRCASGGQALHMNPNIIFNINSNCRIDLPHGLMMPASGELFVTGTFYLQKPVFRTMYYRVLSYRRRMLGADIDDLVEDKIEEVNASAPTLGSGMIHSKQVFSHYEDDRRIDLVSTRIKYNRITMLLTTLETQLTKL